MALRTEATSICYICKSFHSFHQLNALIDAILRKILLWCHFHELLKELEALITAYHCRTGYIRYGKLLSKMLLNEIQHLLSPEEAKLISLNDVLASYERFKLCTFYIHLDKSHRLICIDLIN